MKWPLIRRSRVAQLERELSFERSLSEARKDSRDALRREAARAGNKHYIRLGYLNWLDRYERDEDWETRWLQGLRQHNP